MYKYFNLLIFYDQTISLASGKKIGNALPVAKNRSNRAAWKNIGEYAIFRCMEVFLQLLPVKFVDKLGSVIGVFAGKILPSRSEIVERNLRIAWGESLTKKEIIQLSKFIFRHAGANMLGGMRTAMMSDEQIAHCVEVEGTQQLQEALNTGHGVIVALAHMGNWEVLSRIGHLVSPTTPCGAFYRPLNNHLIDAVVRKRREASNMELYSSKEAFLKASTLLRSGGILGILADQNAGKSGEITPYFGRNISCSPLPSLLQRRTGASVFFASVTRTAPGRWRVSLFPHDEKLPITTSSIMRGLEQALSKSPRDGFWLHNRWRRPLRDILRIKNRRRDPGINRKPWQLVLALSPNEAQRLASLPAVRHLIASLTDCHFHILSEPFDCTASNITFHAIDPKIALSAAIDQLDESNVLPLDLLLVFDIGHLSIANLKKSAVAQCAGFSNGKEFTIPKKLNGQDPTNPATWLSLIDQLGCALPENPLI